MLLSTYHFTWSYCWRGLILLLMGGWLLKQALDPLSWIVLLKSRNWSVSYIHWFTHSHLSPFILNYFWMFQISCKLWKGVIKWHLLPPAGQTLVWAFQTFLASSRGNGLHLTWWNGEGQLICSGPSKYSASEGWLGRVSCPDVLLLFDWIQNDCWSFYIQTWLFSKAYDSDITLRSINKTKNYSCLQNTRSWPRKYNCTELNI